MAARRWWGTEGSANQTEIHQETTEDVLEGLDEYDFSKRPEVRIINRYVRMRTSIMLLFKAVGSLALLWSTVVLLGGFVTLLKKVDFRYLTFIGFFQAAGQFYEIIFIIMQVVIWILHWPVLFLSFGPPVVCFLLSANRLVLQDYGSDDGDASKANLKPALNIFYFLAVAQSVLYILWIVVQMTKERLKLHLSYFYGYELGALNDYITETERKCIHDMSLSNDWNLITYALSLLDSESPDSNDYCSGLRILHALIKEKVPVNRLMIQSSRQRIQKLISMLGWRRPTDRETRELASRILAHLASDLSLADFPGALESISSLLETHSYKKDQESLHFPLRKKQSKVNRKKSVLEDMVEKLIGPGYEKTYYMLLRDEQDIGINIRQGKKEELIVQGLRIVENLAHNERNCTEIYKNNDLLSKIIAPISSGKFIEQIETNGGSSIRAMDGTLKVVSRLIGSHGDIGKNVRQDIAVAGNTNTGRKEASSSKENMTDAISNLVAILGLKRNSNILGLQTRAIEILAQLFLDKSINLDRGEREKFIQSLLQFFISEKWMAEYVQEKHAEVTREATTIKVDNNIVQSLSPLLYTFLWQRTFPKRKKALREEQKKEKMEEAKEIASKLKAKAGEALALLLSTASQSDYNLVMNCTGCGDVKDCLTKMLDSKITTIKCTTSGDEDVPIKIGCRISAAEILKHLWAHSTGDQSFCKTVLRKVLEELVHINTTATEPEARNVIKGSTSTSRPNDEENPRPPSSQQDEPQNRGSNKQQCDKRRFQAALLSLYARICTTWTDDEAGDFANLIVDLVASNDFAGKIKAVIEENSHATPACLAMLKIICEMVTLLVQHGHYVQDFKDKKIIDALSEASKTVASLEGCMLFAGMDVDSYGVPLKPVSSVLVENARQLLDGQRSGADQVANDTIPAGTGQ